MFPLPPHPHKKTDIIFWTLFVQHLNWTYVNSQIVNTWFYFNSKQQRQIKKISTNQWYKSKRANDAGSGVIANLMPSIWKLIFSPPTFVHLSCQ